MPGLICLPKLTLKQTCIVVFTHLWSTCHSVLKHPCLPTYLGGTVIAVLAHMHAYQFQLRWCKPLSLYVCASAAAVAAQVLWLTVTPNQKTRQLLLT